jgi:hypothetical protein
MSTPIIITLFVPISFTLFVYSHDKTPVEDIDPVQNNVNDDPDTTSEYQKYITSTTPNPTNDGGCNVCTVMISGLRDKDVGD